MQSFRIAEGEGIAGNCVQTRQPVMVNDTQKDARFSSRADKKSGFSTRSILCVPLVIENNCIGALGLSITKKIIEEHGGRITVDSTEGRGSTFSISLPTDH